MLRRTRALIALITSHCLLITGVVFATATYRVDPQHASVEFTIAHLMLSTVAGRFHEFAGTIQYDANDVTKSSLAGTIKAASIDTGNKSRDDHLRNEDFFDAPNHPEIRFRTKGVEQRNDVAILIGDLTMRGITREIEIPVVIQPDSGDGRLRFNARLELNRQDFGIAYGGFLDSATIGDIVAIELNGEAIRQ